MGNVKIKVEFGSLNHTMYTEEAFAETDVLADYTGPVMRKSSTEKSEKLLLRLGA